MTAAFLFGLIAFVAVIASLALRDHRRALASRRRLFEQCRGVLQGERWSAGGDGFPELQGLAYGRAVRAVFIPDRLVMRRLPRLWLSVTEAARVRLKRQDVPETLLTGKKNSCELSVPGNAATLVRVSPDQELPVCAGSSDCSSRTGRWSRGSAN